MHTVNKGVPLPDAKHGGTRRRTKYPFDQMTAGDMFFVPGELLRNTVATNASKAGIKMGAEFSTRECFMRPAKNHWKECDQTHADAVRGIGCWRVA